MPSDQSNSSSFLDENHVVGRSEPHEACEIRKFNDSPNAVTERGNLTCDSVK